MKKYMKLLIALSLSLLMFNSHHLYAQEQVLKYNVRVLGMDVGELTVSERIDNGDTVIEATTDVKVRIVFTYRVRWEQKSIHRGGELLNSSLLTYKKDKLNSSTYLTRERDGYLLEKDEETSFIGNSIKYSGSLLYFHEPSGISELYYEINGEMKPLTSIGDHKYRIIDPANGRESVFEYEDGILQRSSIEHGIATIYTERMPD